MGYPVASTLMRSVSDEAVRPRAGVDYPATLAGVRVLIPGRGSVSALPGTTALARGLSLPELWREGGVGNQPRPVEVACGHQTSVTAGTIFHRSRYPLRIWFAAAWFVCSQKTGASALGLKRVLELGSYETAWTWMHKLRRAKKNRARGRLKMSDNPESCPWVGRLDSSSHAVTILGSTPSFSAKDCSVRPSSAMAQRSTDPVIGMAAGLTIRVPILWTRPRDRRNECSMIAGVMRPCPHREVSPPAASHPDGRRSTSSAIAATSPSSPGVSSIGS